MTVTVEFLLQSSSLSVYPLSLDVFAVSKDVQTVSAVAVVVPPLEVENVFVHPNRKPMEHNNTDMANNLHLMLLYSLARQRHPAAVVYSLCPNGRNMNESVTKSKA
jgi:hypothetical protein